MVCIRLVAQSTVDRPRETGQGGGICTKGGREGARRAGGREGGEGGEGGEGKEGGREGAKREREREGGMEKKETRVELLANGLTQIMSADILKHTQTSHKSDSHLLSLFSRLSSLALHIFPPHRCPSSLCLTVSRCLSIYTSSIQAPTTEPKRGTERGTGRGTGRVF